MKLSYSISEELRRKIEARIRKYGSQIITKDFTCSVQYFYQQVSSVHTTSSNKEAPVFTLVEIDDKQYIVTEVGEKLTIPASSIEIPSMVIDICEIDPVLFEKINVFNLKSKTAKRVKFSFTKFVVDESVVLLGEASVMFPEGIQEHAKSIIFGNDMQSAKSLNINASFVRPKIAGLELPLWIYQLAKSTQRVFPGESPMSKPVEFIDCVFAKDLFLV